MAAIQQILEQLYDTAIDNLTELQGGWEADIYAFEVAGQALVIRLMHGNDADIKVQREFEGMRMLNELGYKVPQVHAMASRAESRFGQPYIIMDWIRGGELFGSQVRTDKGFARFSELIRQLHNLDWQTVSDFDSSDSYAFIDAKCAEFRTICEQVLPEFLPAIDWMETRRDDLAAKSFSVLHGDFHPWNILETQDSELWVIDWSSFEIGDPRYDIAWTWLILEVTLGHDQSSRFAREFGVHDLFKAISIIRRLGTVYLSLSASTVEAGMREEAEVGMRREVAVLGGLYEEYLDISGVTIDALEEFLA